MSRFTLPPADGAAGAGDVQFAESFAERRTPLATLHLASATVPNFPGGRESSLLITYWTGCSTWPKLKTALREVADSRGCGCRSRAVAKRGSRFSPKKERRGKWSFTLRLFATCGSRFTPLPLGGSVRKMAMAAG